MNEPVITLKGACQPKAGATAPPAGCVSRMTREQFEKLTKALSPADRPPMPADMMRSFATQYAKLLTFADAAREMGLENDPRVQQICSFAKNQILTEALNQHITEEYSHPTDQQIEDYYNAKQQEVRRSHAAAHHRSQRIGATPKSPSRPRPKKRPTPKRSRQRWVAGEDPEKLEKEAIEHARPHDSSRQRQHGRRGVPARCPRRTSRSSI